MEYSKDHKFIPVTSVSTHLGGEVAQDLYYYTIQIVNICLFGNPEQKNEWVLIDTGMPKSADNILSVVEKRFGSNSRPKAIILTHGHFDHIMAAQELASTTRVSIYAYESERELLANPGLNCSSIFGKSLTLAPVESLRDFEKIQIADIEFVVLHTPGHTKGSVCYYIPDEQILLSGDTLFFESVGRTDFPTGNSGVLIKSINERLFTLPKEVKVYPGHGCSTSIGYEMQNNPYVNGEGSFY